MTGVSRRVGYTEAVPGPRRHWSLLPAVRHGFKRTEDDRGRRMVECLTCGAVIPSLGIGYHVQRKDHGGRGGLRKI